MIFLWICNPFLDGTKISFPHCCGKRPFFFCLKFHKKDLSCPFTCRCIASQGWSPHPHINCLQKGDKQKYFHPFFSLLYIKAIVRKKKNEAGKGQQNKASLQRLQVPYMAVYTKKNNHHQKSFGNSPNNFFAIKEEILVIENNLALLNLNP